MHQDTDNADWSTALCSCAVLLRDSIEPAECKASAGLNFKYIVEDGGLLSSWSGSPGLVFRTCGRGARNQKLFKVKSHDFPQWFYRGWIREHVDEFRAIAAGKATTMDHAQRHHFTSSEVTVPPATAFARGNKLIGDLVNRHVGHAPQSRVLGAHRDILLPGLHSRVVWAEPTQH